MDALRVGFIGTGKRKARPDLNGYFMAYQHAPGYQALPQCKLVACADIVAEHAAEFAAAMDIPATYADYHEMIDKEKLDIISICTWPIMHAPIVLDCIAAGVPAIHCEKPMALTAGGCSAMLAAARAGDTVLTFNHQRRFGAPFRKTRGLIEQGVVGDLMRLECTSGDLYDGGCHWVDLLNYFNGETAPEWVMGQVDCREVRTAFGVPSEYQGIFNWRYRNGVTAVMLTGPQPNTLGPAFRVLGSAGVIEIGWDPTPGPMLRYCRWDAAGWTAVECGGENLHGPGYIERAIADVVDCLQTGRTSELCAENEMKAMDIVFGAYESARRRGRVDLPLTIADHPLMSMLEAGEIGPEKTVFLE